MGIVSQVFGVVESASDIDSLPILLFVSHLTRLKCDSVSFSLVSFTSSATPFELRFADGERIERGEQKSS